MSTTTEPQVINALLRIPLELIEPGPNVRDVIAGINELATSIKTLGMQKPLLVIDTGNGRYSILDGHRRYAAAKRLGLAHVDAILRRQAPDVVRIQQQLAIQSQTEGFDPIAEARALHSLMWDHKLSREEIARAVGRSPIWVRDRIALLQCTEDEKRAVAGGRMTVSAALGMVSMRRAQRDGREVRTPSGFVAHRTSGKHCKTCTCGGVA